MNGEANQLKRPKMAGSPHPLKKNVQTAGIYLFEDTRTT